MANTVGMLLNSLRNFAVLLEDGRRVGHRPLNFPIIPEDKIVIATVLVLATSVASFSQRAAAALKKLELPANHLIEGAVGEGRPGALQLRLAPTSLLARHMAHRDRPLYERAGAFHFVSRGLQPRRRSAEH